jgi:hypothetical protein
LDAATSFSVKENIMKRIKKVSKEAVTKPRKKEEHKPKTSPKRKEREPSPKRREPSIKPKIKECKKIRPMCVFERNRPCTRPDPSPTFFFCDEPLPEVVGRMGRSCTCFAKNKAGGRDCEQHPRTSRGGGERANSNCPQISCHTLPVHPDPCGSQGSTCTSSEAEYNEYDDGLSCEPPEPLQMTSQSSCESDDGADDCRYNFSCTLKASNFGPHVGFGIFLFITCQISM